MAKKKLVVLTGAGISAESGLKTFRDSDGLWEGYNVEEVATPRAWRKNPKLVLDFYNMRRKNVADAQPNAAHYGLAALENEPAPRAKDSLGNKVAKEPKKSNKANGITSAAKSKSAMGRPSSMASAPHRIPGV